MPTLAKRVCEGHAPERELTARPDLLRLTRRVLPVAELLPWPVKVRLFQAQPWLAPRRDIWKPSFLEGTALNQRTARVDRCGTASHSRDRAVTATTPLSITLMACNMYCILHTHYSRTPRRRNASLRLSPPLLRFSGLAPAHRSRLFTLQNNYG